MGRQKEREGDRERENESIKLFPIPFRKGETGTVVTVLMFFKLII